MVFGFFKNDSAPKPIIKQRVDPNLLKKAAASATKFDEHGTDYSFNVATPSEFQSTQRTRSMAPRTKILGAILGIMVVSIYTFTVFNLKQDDFADVIVPENIREKEDERQTILQENKNINFVKVGKLANNEQESLENEIGVESKQVIDARTKQNRALQDFFRDTGGKVSDLRVLRTAMFLSDEIDRAVRGVDIPGQYVGWRPYNRFYAEGTEDLFTNVPTGRSPLVLAAPKAKVQLPEVDAKTKTLPIEYQAVRRSHLKQVGRLLDEIEQNELLRLEEEAQKLQKENVEEMRNRLTWKQRESIDQLKTLRKEQSTTMAQEKNPFDQLQHGAIVVPKVLNAGPSQTTSLEASLYQPVSEDASGVGKMSTKEKLFKFEGEISDKKIFEDYKFEDYD